MAAGWSPASADPPPASLVRPVPGSSGSLISPPAPKAEPQDIGPGDETVISGAVTGVTVRIQPAGHPELPTTDQVEHLLVPLAQRDGVWQPAPAGAEPMQLGSIRGPISSAAANVCSRSVLALFRERHIDGVVARVVAPEAGKSSPLIVAVMAGTVSAVRTRVIEDNGSQSVDAPRYSRIAEKSPVQPAPEGEAATLLRQEMLEDYLAQLNRLPGRQVSSDIGAGDIPGTVMLDYLLQDRKMFMVQVQGSNTGTEQNGRWVEQVGIVGTRLLNLDDILDIRGATNTFDAVYSVSGSWEGRCGDLDRLRWRVFGDWSEYDASDVGIQGNNFTGTTWGGGGSLAWNFLQVHDFFVDFEAGVRGWYSSVDQALGFTGSSSFVTPSAKFNFFRQTRNSVFTADIGLDWTSANGSTFDLAVLGRTNPSKTWFNFHGDVLYTLFLDSLFDPNSSTAVHQLTARGSWQWTPGNARPTPVAQDVAGGFYTVRGYPQAIAVGDNAVIGGLQYDFHLLRALPDSQPTQIFGKPFRWTTEAGTGMPPSWDLSPHVFFDAAYTSVNAPTFGEPQSATLTSVGVGITAMVGTDFSITLDFGVALNSQPNLGVEAGDTQVWFVGSIGF